MINTRKLNEEIKRQKISKKEICVNSGISRVTLDKILNGGEVNVSSLESLAKGLGVSVGFFFDETEIVAETAISTQGGVSVTGHGSASVNVSAAEHDELIRLRVEVKMLNEIKEEMQRHITDLKSQIEDMKSE